MSDLIKREDAMKVAMWFGRSEQKYSHSFIKKRVMEIPSAERKGEWKDRGMRVPSSWVKKCSLCGYETDTWRWCNFCPNCGARMKGADDE